MGVRNAVTKLELKVRIEKEKGIIRIGRIII